MASTDVEFGVSRSNQLLKKSLYEQTTLQLTESGNLMNSSLTYFIVNDTLELPQFREKN